MGLFPLIFIVLPLLNVVWWFWTDRRVRRLRHAQVWRLIAAALAALFLTGYAWTAASRFGGLPSLPAGVLIAVYMWHLVILPITVVLLTGYELLRLPPLLALRWLRPRPAPRPLAARNDPPAGAPDPPDDLSPKLTRRQALSAAAASLPPAALVLGTLRAASQLNSFRLRRLEIALPALPPALDGLTIAHISDVHVGRFTNGRILDDVVARTNALRPDLVFMTGDLIDAALHDLPAGLSMLNQLEPRAGLFMCEGNHDLFESRTLFERRVQAAGVRLLLNEAVTLNLRGQSVQVLGLRWGQPGTTHGPLVGQQFDDLLPHRRGGAFAILLAHHPHAFDWAAEERIPLTLSGHTHGGQLMLSPRIGAGPLLFKYWSGLYRQGASALVVSNGVGNWLPLRINAPAEILHLTLRAPTPQA